MTGAAVSSVLVEFRGRHGALELFVQISWHAQYFGAWCRFRGRHFALTQRDRSRCGAVHILRT